MSSHNTWHFASLLVRVDPDDFAKVAVRPVGMSGQLYPRRHHSQTSHVANCLLAYDQLGPPRTNDDAWSRGVNCPSERRRRIDPRPSIRRFNILQLYCWRTTLFSVSQLEQTFFRESET